MFGLMPFKFRFRGHVSAILDIYFAFLDCGNEARHPVQLARATGRSLGSIAARLEATPEVFVKMPARQGDLTRYRVTSSAMARTPEQIEAKLIGYERNETLVLYALVTMVMCLLTIVVLTIIPGL